MRMEPPTGSDGARLPKPAGSAAAGAADAIRRLRRVVVSPTI